MAIARSLIVDIAMNTAKITKDIEKVRSNFDKVRSTAKKLGGILVAAFSVRAVLAYTERIIDLGDELNKTSQKIGISVEKLSAYEYAARLSGSSSDELRVALTRLSANMQDAAINKTSQAAKTFKSLGIEVSDTQGRLKDTSIIFQQVSDRFAAAADGPNKTAAAVKLMGRSGAELIPLLNNLKEVTSEAEKTGNVISKDFAEASERFNDSIERTTSAFGNFSRGIISNVLPSINRYIEILNVAIGAQDNLSLSALSIQRAELANSYLLAAKMAKRYGADVDKATESIRQQIDVIDQQIIALNKAQGATALKDKPQLKLPEIEKKAASSKVGKSEAEDAIRAENEISEGLTREGITRQTELIIAEEQARRQRKMEIIRESILDEDTLRQEQFEKRLEEVEIAYEQDIINLEDRNKIIEQMELEHQAKMGDIEAQGALARQAFEKMTSAQKREFILNELLRITEGVAAHNKTLFKINKALAIAQIAISAPSAIAQAIERGGGLPWGAVFGVATAAAMVAQLNAVKSASFGAATSAPSVGGGGATPVTRATNVTDQPLSQSASQRPSQNITINIQNGVGDKAYWQEMIDEIIVPGINDASERNINLNIRTV